MCGIIGYIGNKDCHNILLDGLTHLEYRGYDSAGIAILKNNEVERYRAEGKLNNLKKIINENSISGNIGIGHTRWATHGEPNEKNAHPHKSEKFHIVHNGIIENYKQLKKDLQDKGFIFSSDTDSEIIVHLIEYYNKKGNNFENSVSKAIKKLDGAFAVLVINREEEKLIAFKKYSPLILGVGKEENFVASDIPAILSHTNNFVYLEDGTLAVLKKNNIKIMDFDLNELSFEVKKLNISPIMAEKGNFKHFMLKEIFEQARAISDTFRGRILKASSIDLEFSEEFDNFLKKDLNKIVIVACGTSWHASLIAKYLIEELARIPVEVDYASEYRYRNSILEKNNLVIAVSQSGETADTLAAVNIAKESGVKILSICNVFNSTIPRNSDEVLYTYAGIEIGVASTKAFTTQMSIFTILSLYLRSLRIDKKLDNNFLESLLSIPKHIASILENAKNIKYMARKYNSYDNFLYLGRGLNFPIALEGALKLKEISYIHAEAYPSGEMKHGPIALIDEKMPTFIIATDGNHYQKVLSNLQEIRARKGRIIAIASEGNNEIKKSCDDVIYVPKVDSLLEPFVSVIPLQLFAYYIADMRGTDLDQPRNLAKSVTVE